MTTNTQKEILAVKAKLALLEKKAEAEANNRILNLHKEAGFETRDELIAALKSIGGTAPKSRKATKAKKVPKAKKAAAPKAKAAKASAAPKASERAKRTVVTDKLRKGIIAALKAGGKGNAVAAKFGISVPTLHNIKKAAGLTKSRK